MMKRLQENLGLNTERVIKLPGPIDIFSFNVASNQTDAAEIALSSGFVKIVTTQRIIKGKPNDVVCIGMDQPSFRLVDTYNLRVSSHYRPPAQGVGYEKEKGVG